jgi:glycosyltransferase involved in cell wall biosynthesis
MLVRYYGHVGQPSGYGHAANETCMAILAAGLELEIQTDGKELHKRYLPLAPCVKETANLNPAPDVVIVHTLPLDCPRILALHGLDFVCTGDSIPVGPRRIAYTTWEGCPPVSHEIIKALSGFDEVWVPSRHNQDAFRAAGAHWKVSTQVVPHAYDADTWPTPDHDVAFHAASDLATPTPPYTFYYVGAWNSRKNADAVVRAYARTFVPSERVSLVVQSAGAPQHAVQLALMATGLAPEEWPAFHFSNERLLDVDIDGLHACADCFVTASRGEAWNLPAFDAMLHGNHVIAPFAQGSDDFLADTSSDLIGATRIPAFGEVRMTAAPGGARVQYVGCQGLTVRSTWLDPDIIQLGEAMREAFERRAVMVREYDPASRFSRQVVGTLIKNLLTNGATTS